MALDIDKEQFNLWKHDPVTKLVFRVLADRKERMKELMIDGWLAGSKSFTETNQTIRGQIIELEEVIGLEFEAIEAFYYTEEDNGINSKGPFGSSR